MKLNIIKYKTHKDWYKNTTVYLKETYGKDYKIVAGLLAATSPRMQVKRNWEVTSKIYADYKAGNINQSRFGQKRYRDVLKRRYGIMEAHIFNVVRAFKGEPLSGMKVKSFNDNLTGNLKSVTIDTWMQKFFKVKSVNKTTYNNMSNKTTQIGLKFKLKPAEIQAIIWTQIRQENGYKPVDFLSVVRGK